MGSCRRLRSLLRLPLGCGCLRAPLALLSLCQGPSSLNQVGGGFFVLGIQEKDCPGPENTSTPVLYHRVLPSVLPDYEPDSRRQEELELDCRVLGARVVHCWPATVACCLETRCSLVGPLQTWSPRARPKRTTYDCSAGTLVELLFSNHIETTN